MTGVQTCALPIYGWDLAYGMGGAYRIARCWGICVALACFPEGGGTDIDFFAVRGLFHMVRGMPREVARTRDRRRRGGLDGLPSADRTSSISCLFGRILTSRIWRPPKDEGMAAENLALLIVMLGIVGIVVWRLRAAPAQRAYRPKTPTTQDKPNPYHSVSIRSRQDACETADRKSTRLNSSHMSESRMPSSA